MTSIQPELWVENAPKAVAFYRDAFGASVRHLVGEGDDIVAQLSVGEAVFWVAPASPAMKRLSPRAASGATGRILLVVDDPDAVAGQAISVSFRRRLHRCQNSSAHSPLGLGCGLAAATHALTRPWGQVLSVGIGEHRAHSVRRGWTSTKSTPAKVPRP